MRVRDRLVVAGIVAVVVVGFVWVLLVSPKRGEASSLSAQITTEQGALATAQASLASARSAAAGYMDDVRALAEVTTAVPVNLDEPAALTTITRLAGTKVDVHEVTVGGGGGAPGGQNVLGLSFTFNATYADLQSFITALDRLTTTDGTNIAANGRLFTISELSIAPKTPTSAQVTLTASAYAQSAASAAVPISATGATGATGAPAATTAASTGATSTSTPTVAPTP